MINRTLSKTEFVMSYHCLATFWSLCFKSHLFRVSFFYNSTKIKLMRSTCWFWIHTCDSAGIPVNSNNCCSNVFNIRPTSTNCVWRWLAWGFRDNSCFIFWNEKSKYYNIFTKTQSLKNLLFMLQEDHKLIYGISNFFEHCKMSLVSPFHLEVKSTNSILFIH